jgi:small subunit ribosomal protein S9
MKQPEFFYGTGRRKCSAARVFLKPATSETFTFTVNNTSCDTYFTRSTDVISLLKPLELVDKSQFKIFASVTGGGSTGQRDALKMGLARALLSFDQNLHGPLKEQNFLTRDSRMVERKKPGCRKARKKQQFKKR